MNLVGNLKDELIRNRIVIGITDKQLSKQLRLHATLTLENAITKFRLKELVHKQQVKIQNVVVSVNVSRVKGDRKNSKCWFGGSMEHKER